MGAGPLGAAVPASSGSGIGVAPATPAAPSAPAPAQPLSKPDAETLAAAARQQEFAFALYRELAALADANGGPTRANFVFSPWSAGNSLGLLATGARGDTAAELSKALGFPAGATAAQIADAGRRLYRRADGLARSGNLTFLSASSLWVQANTGFQAAFLYDARYAFGAALFGVNFSAEPAAALARINTWSAEHTGGVFARLVPASAVTLETRALAVAALHLDAPWRHYAEPEPASVAFKRPGQAPRYPVYLRCGVDAAGLAEGAAIYELPFCNPSLVCTILLPPEKTPFPEFERALTPAKLARGLATTQRGPWEVRAPKFVFDFTFSLSSGLRGLGVVRAFEVGRADFSGIAEKADMPNLSLSDVRHGAKFAFHERGATATAATTASAHDPFGTLPEAGLSPRLDRPFVFLVRDRESGLIFFMGRLADPGG